MYLRSSYTLSYAARFEEETQTTGLKTKPGVMRLSPVFTRPTPSARNVNSATLTWQLDLKWTLTFYENNNDTKTPALTLRYNTALLLMTCRLLAASAKYISPNIVHREAISIAWVSRYDVFFRIVLKGSSYQVSKKKKKCFKKMF